jgi:hypothetical protein
MAALAAVVPGVDIHERIGIDIKIDFYNYANQKFAFYN